PWLQVTVIFILYIWMKEISGSKWASFIFTLLLGGSLGYANFVKLDLRKEPVFPSDLSMLKESASLVEMADEIDWPKIAVIALFLFIIGSALVFIEHKAKKEYEFKRFFYVRLISVVISSFLVLQLYGFNKPSNFIRRKFDENTTWI